MTTYAEVRDLIIGDLHRANMTTQVQTALDNARDKVRMDRFYFNEAQSSFTVSSTSDYDLDTVLPDLLLIDSVRVWEDGSPSQLRRSHWDTLIGIDETTVTGKPSAWAVHHRMLRLAPTPDASMAAEVSYLKELSVTAWCSYAPTLMRALAEVELYNMVLHDEVGANRAAQAAQIEKQALLRRLPTAASSGETRPWL